MTGEGTWQVIGIATVQLSGCYTFLCMTDDDGASLRWYAVGNFTTVSQSSVHAGQLLTINETQESDFGEYVCRDIASGNEARLNLTGGIDFAWLITLLYWSTLYDFVEN